MIDITNKNENAKSPKKIKVFFFIGTSLSVGRGYEQTVLAYARHMNFERFQVNIINTDIGGEERVSRSELDNLQKELIIYELKIRNSSIRKLPLVVKRFPLGKVLEVLLIAPLAYRLMLASGLKRQVPNISPEDIVYLFDGTYHTLFRNNTKLLIGANHGLFENPRALYTRIIVSLVRKGIALRRIKFFHLFPMNEFLINKFTNKECAVIPSGIEASNYTVPNILKSDVVKLFFIGALQKWKGIELAIEAFKILDCENVEFHIAGAGELTDWIKKESKIDQRIKFHGLVSDKEKMSLYYNCDIFLYPSMGETFGLVVVEALASGMHAIVGNRLISNFTELVQLNYITPCNYDPTEISRIIGRLISDIDSIRSERKEIHEHIINMYDWSAITHNLMLFFEKIKAETQ